MPKRYKLSTPASNSHYVHPSLGSTKSNPEPSPDAPTVNERLQQLRTGSGPSELTQLQKQLADASTLRSVPPELHSILGVPDSRPPPSRSRARPDVDRLRTPGPAPPRSWLAAGGRLDAGAHRFGTAAPRQSRQFGLQKCKDRPRPATLGSFATLIGDEQINPRTLLHQALRCIAQQWAAIDDEGLAFLGECPNKALAALPSYIAFYGPDEGLSAYSLECLLTGAAAPSSLDLTCLVGWSLSVKQLAAIFSRRAKASTAQESGAVQETVDSWDAADEHENVTALSMLSITPPAAISRLSLANPPPTVSWNDLLTLTSHLPTLTHLSLAQWPCPSTSTAHGPLSDHLSPGPTSSMLSHDDMATARSLLRHLSKNTYCLTHLDVSACDWVAALVPSHAPTRRPTSDWDPPPRPNGPDYAGAWRLLTTVRMAQSAPPTALPQVVGAAPALHHPASNASADESFVRRELGAYLCAAQPMPTRSGVGGWTAWRSLENRGKVCKACGAELGGAQGRERGCAGCVAWAEQAGRVVDGWVGRETGLREVGREVKRCLVQLGAGRAVGRVRVDLGWMEV